MSLAVNEQIQPKLVLDKRLGFDTKRDFGVIKAGQTNSYKVLPTQNYSTSNVTFNAQPPSPGIAINREILASFYYEVSFSGTAGTLNGGTLLYPGMFDAPRAFPISQTTQNIQATINNASVAQNNYQLINAFMHSNISDDEIRRDFSLAPSMLDTYQNYDDPYFYGTGVANDPLQAYGQNSYFNTRGAWDVQIISNPVVGAGNAATAVVRFSATEPLLLSPFLNGNDNNIAFIGVQTLTLQFNLTNLARIWSHSAGNGDAGTITTTAVTFYQAPELLLNFITPSSLQEIPRSNVYSYNNVDVYPTDFTSIAAGATTTINSQNIQLNYIPKRIYIFVRRSDATSTISTTDTFLRINSCNINFDNVSGVLSGANSKQLYELSKNSGLNLTWTEWNQHIGSILVLDVGRSIMLQDPTEAPSLTTTKQFQVQLSVTNINQRSAIVPTMYIVTIADGIITVDTGTAILQNTILSKEDVLNVGTDAANSTSWIKSQSWFGGKLTEAGDAFTKMKNRVCHGGASVGGASVGGASVGGGRVMKSKKQLLLM